jgi:hypothetical protein
MPGPRKLGLLERAGFAGWGCLGCNWIFHLPQHLKATSLDDLIRQTEALRDAAFAAHNCVRPRSGKRLRAQA